MEPSTEPMTPIKRKDVDGTSDNDEPHKKMKQEEEEAGFPTPQPGAGLTQGPDDASITSLFSLLLYGINTFVQAYFLGYPYLIPRKNDQKEFFESLTGSDCIAYLKSKHPGAKQAIITAAVWVKLIRALLGVPTKAFIEEMPEMKIKRGTAGNPEAFYAWRTFTAHFLANNYKSPASWGEGGSRREAFVEEVMSLLLDHSVVEEKDKLESDLEGIADKAFQLASAMARSRAHWVCRMSDPRVNRLHTFKIKNDRMNDVDLWEEDEGHGKSTIVDLIKTPMLLKFGNSDGQNYDQCRVFKKADVVVKAKNEHE